MILDKIFGQTEARSGLKQPASWLSTILTGGTTNNSGVEVNEHNAMQLTAVYSAINVISNGIATPPLQPFRKTKGRTALAENHPVYPLVTQRANPHMSAYEFRRQLESHALRWGNGYAWIESVNGFPVALWPLKADETTLVSLDGQIYCTSTINGKPVSFAYSDVIHIKALGWDGLVGKSPIRQHAEEIGIQIAAQNFGAEFFGNGATVQGVIKHPGKLDPDARKAIKESWNKAHSGTGNRHGTAIFPDGMSYERVGIPPEEAQFLETRQYGDQKIAQIYSVPPHMIGDLSKATFSNITEETMNFVRRTLSPWFVQWEQELTYKLFTETERKRYCVKFDTSEILKGTPKEEAEADAILVNTGMINRNEARVKRSYNPVEGLDEFLVPLNMIELSEAVEAQGGEEETDRSLVDVLPLIKRFSEVLLNAERKVASKGNLDKWKEQDAEKFIERHLAPVLDSIDKREALEEFITTYSQLKHVIPDDQVITNSLLELIA